MSEQDYIQLLRDLTFMHGIHIIADGEILGTDHLDKYDLAKDE